jgi:hypothetical protein
MSLGGLLWCHAGALQHRLVAFRRRDRGLPRTSREAPNRGGQIETPAERGRTAGVQVHGGAVVEHAPRINLSEDDNFVGEVRDKGVKC